MRGAPPLAHLPALAGSPAAFPAGSLLWHLALGSGFFSPGQGSMVVGLLCSWADTSSGGRQAAASPLRTQGPQRSIFQQPLTHRRGGHLSLWPLQVMLNCSKGGEPRQLLVSAHSALRVSSFMLCPTHSCKATTITKATLMRDCPEHPALPNLPSTESCGHPLQARSSSLMLGC